MGCMLRSLRFNSVPATIDARCLQCYSNTGCCCLIWLLLGFAMAMKPSIYGRPSAVYGSAVVLQPSSRGFEAWLQLEEANGWDLECLLKILEVGFRNAKQQWLLWTFRDAPTACLTSFPMLAHVGVPGSQTPTSFPINYAGTRPCLRIAVYCGPFVSVFNQLLKAPMVGSLRCKPQSWRIKEELAPPTSKLSAATRPSTRSKLRLSPSAACALCFGCVPRLITSVKVLVDSRYQHPFAQLDILQFGGGEL